MRPHRTPLRIAALVLTLVVMAGTYSTPMVLAHAVGASSIRIVVLMDDRHHEPTTNYFFSITFLGMCVRVEWIAAGAPRDASTRT